MEEGREMREQEHGRGHRTPGLRGTEQTPAPGTRLPFLCHVLR